MGPDTQLDNIYATLTLIISKWTDDALLLLMEHVALLEELTINNGNNLSDTSLQQLPRYCPHLKKLHLVGCRMTQPSFKALGQYCPQLSRLTIKHCRDLPPDAFTILADAATQYHHACSLERLCLSFGALPGLSLSLEDETAMDLTVLHGLTHLTLCDPPAAILRRIATHSRTCCSSSSWWWWWWPRLISLTIFGCYDLMDSDVIPLLQMCGGDDGGDGLRLEHLRLMNGDLSDATLDAIPAGNRLMTVDVSNNHRITHRAVRRLIIRSPLLTWIDVSSCGGVNMDHFPETAAGQQHYRSEVRDRTRHLYRLYGLYHLDQQDITNIRRSPNNIDSGD
ncbi:unnamed protein product [Absidia cylindrospora]